ncbi:MAG: SurA N-terminal domain-containing protein [Armatimonadota bacterium]
MSIYKLRTEFGQHLKWVMLGIAIIFIVGAIFTFGAMPGSKGGNRVQGGNDVVAVVNGKEIQRSDFENAWEATSEQAKERGIRSALQLADYRAAVFAQMVQGRLILSEAEKMGVDISDRKVNDEVDKEVVKALMQNRESIMGSDLSDDERTLDPRDDSKFKRELSSIGQSIGVMEDAIREKIPADDIRAKLAYEGIQNKIEKSLKPVSEQDVTDSYNVYKIRQISFLKGMMPEDQLKTRINKIMTEIRGGADFAKIAKENSQGSLMNSSSATEYSFDTRWSLPAQVRDAIAKLEPGGVSSPIKTDYGTFIVKLESVTPKLPAKMDKKTNADRRKQIADDRKMAGLMTFQTQMQKDENVKVSDPELRAYWLIVKSRTAFTDPTKSMKMSADAINALKKARANRLDNQMINAKLAQLLYENGKVKEGLDILYPLVEGANDTIDTPDLRILLGDMLMAQAAKDKPEQKAATTAKALEQYKTASDVAHNDRASHEQLVTKFQQLKHPELVAAEQKWLADYDKRAKAMQAEQRRSAPKPSENGSKK